ncbi:glycosyltransferase family 2 protein [Niabella drilacis]|uniref:Glycosyltransferase involved in cell wall bisynthesis n=1 Tax=Niabella drilacis (strain DSM 25811 / CCM 8410 / CCUG 62505 / LMG 26954 / E90) TaxID=1285928 RepID=A0A1G6V155_NIADE|nr:glycosyltransferase family 2 protein [Niabella drilacis]SDD47231.1 Glycosyltransferase involved in cell wall bisynthesis [Niabella drilacis]
MSFFSIVIPAHNNADSIIETIHSVKDQSFKEWQCIIVDDYSTDYTAVSVQNCVCGDNRFLFIKNDSGKGANVCRNLGMNKSNGKYLVFLDADDILLPFCLQNRADVLSGKKVDLLISPTVHFDTSLDRAIGTFKCAQNFSLDEMIAAFIEHRILWTTTGATWKRDFLLRIGGWNENYPRLQDVELNIRALLQIPRISFLECPDSHLRRSAFTKQKQEAAFAGFNLLLRDYYFKIVGGINEELLEQRYQRAFASLTKIILTYWCRLKINLTDKWGLFFLETAKEIMEEPDFVRTERLLRSINKVGTGI